MQIRYLSILSCLEQTSRLASSPPCHIKWSVTCLTFVYMYVFDSMYNVVYRSDKSFILLFYMLLRTSYYQYTTYTTVHTKPPNLKSQTFPLIAPCTATQNRDGVRVAANDNGGNWWLGGDWGPIRLLWDALHRQLVIQGIRGIGILVFWYLGNQVIWKYWSSLLELGVNGGGRSWDRYGVLVW